MLKNLNWICVFLIATLLSGCFTTRHVWRKDGTSSEQAQQEKALCLYNAEVLCGTQYRLSETEAKNRESRFEFLYKQCMMAKGYQEIAIEE